MDFEGRARIRTHLEMAPLIDVVFLLLIFFLLTTTFMVQEAVDLRLPRAETGEASDPSLLEVILTRNGRLTFNGEPVTLDELEAAMTVPLQGDPEQAVILKVDSEVAVQGMLEIMDRIRSAGGRNLALATERGRVP